MITNKLDMERYLYEDEIARFGERVSIFRKMRMGEMWFYQVHLRKLEYYMNCRKDICGILMVGVHRLILKHLGMKLGWSISPNSFGPGMCVVHRGTVVVNGGARIGSNCRVHVCVNIGANGGGLEDTPSIGDNVYIGPGAKIFGKIHIGDNTVIGANSVINKDFLDGGYTIAGAPTRIISNKDSSRFIKRSNQLK